MRRHLAARGVEGELAQCAIDRLLADDYLDDARYALRFAEDRRRLDGWGADRIRRRLLADGIAPEWIEAALATRAPGAELDAALELLRRRFDDVDDTPRQRERAHGFLLRRGYDSELAYDAIRVHRRRPRAA